MAGSASLQGLERQALVGFPVGMENMSIRNFGAQDRDWLIKQHADHYARAEGFDETFGILVTDIIDSFLTNHCPNDEAGWIAQAGEKRLGSIVCVRLDDTTAKLRLFLLVPEARGKAVGYRLLRTCMEFSKDKGYSAMQLWTHESHRAAGALYRRNGWTLTQTKPVHSFGCDLVEQSWIYRF